MGKFVGQEVARLLNDESSAGQVKTPAHPGQATLARFSAYLEPGNNDKLGPIREEMRNLMTEKVGVFRTEEGISQAIEGLRELKARADQTGLSQKGLTMNQELIERFEMDNLLAVAMVIAQAALARRESRGAHFREDYPNRSDEFNYHTLTWMPVFDQLKWGRRPIDRCLFDDGTCEYVEGFDFIERKY